MSTDRIYYFDTYVAGRRYHQADLAWDGLRPGMPLELRRDRDNQHDDSAVAIFATTDSGTYMLGFLPMSCNRPLAQLLDMGWGDAFSATLSRLDPSADYDKQIGLIVSIVRRTDKKNKADRKQTSTEKEQASADNAQTAAGEPQTAAGKNQAVARSKTDAEFNLWKWKKRKKN